MVSQEIIKLIEKAIKRAQKQKKLSKFKIPEITVDHPENEEFGDYSVNVAMRLAGVVKKNPVEIAEVIVSNISDLDLNNFSQVEVVRPGFINFFLANEYLIKELNSIIKEKEKYGSSKIGKGKTMVIDYSGPNIAKSFGIGHLRSTIIGQAVYNIYEFLGWKCIGDNHLGDWGTQFGKLLYQIKKDKKDKNLKKLTIEELEKLYIKFHKEAVENPDIEEEARQWFKKLEKGDKEAKKIWQVCRDLSLKGFNEIYNFLNVKIDYSLGESFYQKKSEDIIEEAKKKKIAKKSQNALVIKYSKEKLPPLMLLKSDGATTYAARDLATIKYRLNKWKPNLVIYEVGTDQILHLKQVFEVVKLLGWQKKEKFIHIAHGLWRWKDGKFSTRKGKTILLKDILNEAIERAKKIIQKSETGRGFSTKEKEDIAEIVGIGAVKYNDLSQHHSKDIIFSWKKVLNLEGNSGPYLQYTYTRCQSVFKKANKKSTNISLTDFNQEEKILLRTFYKFPEIVQEAGDSFSPNLICNFAFDLAQKYNAFYNLHPIIKAKTSQEKEVRLAITLATAQVIKNSLTLLGIKTSERM